MKQCPDLDLVFVNAPSPSKPAPGIEMFFPDGPFYQFYDTQTAADGTKTYANLRENVDKTVRILEENGPFDGVIGFSQGANVAAMIAGVTEAEKPGLIKFVVCMCGVESGWAAQLPDLLGLPANPGVTMPSLHIHAKLDGFLPMSERLASLFASPEIKSHSGDHRPLPADLAEARSIAKAIGDFIHSAVGGVD